MIRKASGELHLRIKLNGPQRTTDHNSARKYTATLWIADEHSESAMLPSSLRKPPEKPNSLKTGGGFPDQCITDYSSRILLEFGRVYHLSLAQPSMKHQPSAIDESSLYPPASPVAQERMFGLVIDNLATCIGAAGSMNLEIRLVV